MNSEGRKVARACLGGIAIFREVFRPGQIFLPSRLLRGCLIEILYLIDRHVPLTAGINPVPNCGLNCGQGSTFFR